MSDETCLKVAAILKIHAGLVMIDMHRERASTPEQVNIWKDISRGFLLLLMPAKRGFC